MNLALSSSLRSGVTRALGHKISTFPFSSSSSLLRVLPSSPQRCHNFSTEASPSVSSKSSDPYPALTGFDHIEVYCSNAKQSAYWYSKVLGFKPIAYAGLETGVKDRASYVLEQNGVRIVLTSPLHPDGPLNAFINKHGDGVKIVALGVEDAADAIAKARNNGGEVWRDATTEKDEHGTAVTSAVKTYGEVVHLFVDRTKYRGLFLPGYQPFKAPFSSTPVGLEYIDHIVGNVDWGEMVPVCQWYEKVMGFTNLISFDDKDISTEYTALMSKVMTNGSGAVRFPINEPAKGRKKSQIEEYLDFNHDAGVQHVALRTKDIIATVANMRDRGCEFLRVPDTYYDTVKQRCGEIKEDVKELKKLGILVDRDEDGYLLQIFTKPVCDRPTLFFEIIQRAGAQSFGKGNFKALFESIEAEQANRGTL